MSKLYQPIKNNPYRLRDSIYWRVIWDIRSAGKYLDGYYDSIPQYAPAPEIVDKVLQAVREQPAEYRDMVFENIVHEVAFPPGYRGKSTTMRKAAFIYRCAELLGYPLGAREIVHIEYDWR